MQQSWTICSWIKRLVGCIVTFCKLMQHVENEAKNHEDTEWLYGIVLSHGNVEDKDEGGFVVSYPDLPGCITCGETRESAVVNALDAKKAWLEAYFQNNDCEGISTQL